jgi:hypothetical protein
MTRGRGVKIAHILLKGISLLVVSQASGKATNIEKRVTQTASHTVLPKVLIVLDFNNKDHASIFASYARITRYIKGSKIPRVIKIEGIHKTKTDFKLGRLVFIKLG